MVLKVGEIVFLPQRRKGRGGFLVVCHGEAVTVSVVELRTAIIMPFDYAQGDRNTLIAGRVIDGGGWFFDGGGWEFDAAAREFDTAGWLID